MRRIPSMYLSPSGAGTRVHLILLLALSTYPVIGFIAEPANKINLSETRSTEVEPGGTPFEIPRIGIYFCSGCHCFQ